MAGAWHRTWPFRTGGAARSARRQREKPHERWKRPQANCPFRPCLVPGTGTRLERTWRFRTPSEREAHLVLAQVERAAERAERGRGRVALGDVHVADARAEGAGSREQLGGGALVARLELEHRHRPFACEPEEHRAAVDLERVQLE